MCQYMHIRAYTYIFILEHTAKSLSGGVLEGNLPTFSGSSMKSRPMGHEPGSQCSDMARGTAQHGRGGCKRGTGRVRRGGGCAKSRVQKCRLRRKQMHAQMRPWGALSEARWLPSIGNVFWGIGINSRVSGDHS